jgi:hypothetical protein
MTLLLAFLSVLLFRRREPSGVTDGTLLAQVPPFGLCVSIVGPISVLHAKQFDPIIIYFLYKQQKGNKNCVHLNLLLLLALCLFYTNEGLRT